jgi:hypothetical protein
MDKRTRPETMNEARSFETVKTHAVEYGLCIHCSSRLAWGHQNGFRELEPPCKEDFEKIQQLPVEKQNGWKTVAGRAAAGSSWPRRVDLT